MGRLRNAAQDGTEAWDPVPVMCATRGWENATATDVRDRRSVQKPSKYRNVKTRIGDEVFDSKREAARWQELKALEHAGQIRSLRRQVRHPLYCPVIYQGAWSQVAEYVSDFDYEEATGSPVIWQCVVEDVKGGKVTQLYALKRKWLELQTGVSIREVR